MIRFPRKHIADDVAERIMQASKSLQPDTVQSQGQQLDQALQQPVGDVAAIPDLENILASRALGL